MFKLYRKYLRFYKKEVVLGPLFKLIEAVFELIVPLVLAYIIDNGIKKNNTNTIWKMGGILVLLAVVGLLSTLVCQYFASKVASKIGTRLRGDLYRHVNFLSNKELDEIGASSLQTRLINDTTQVQNSIAMLIRLAIRAPFIVIGATIMAFTISPLLAIIFVVSAILIGLIIYFVSKLSLPHNKKVQHQLDELTTITDENIRGARVVRAFSKQRYEQRRFCEKSDEIQKTSTLLAKVSSCLNPFTGVVVNLAIILLIYFGMFQVDESFISQGELMALVNYMTQISIAIVVVANLVVLFTKASASSKRINEVFEKESTLINGNEKVDKGPLEVEFKNVCFKYSKGANNAINNINFKLNKGKSLGIIGGTGSGKSTLINLIDRFYDVTEGTILINGKELSKYDLKSLRDSIAIVHQKSTLFSGTVSSNLNWGNKDAKIEDYRKALQDAQALDFVMSKNNGIDAEVVQEGRNFSGGQKQRLSIARALIKSVGLLILDDSTSALDYKTEADLKKTLFKEYQDVSLIMISQRISTVKNLDSILVLDEGYLVGCGKHEELYKTCKVYREIADSQLSKREVNGDE